MTEANNGTISIKEEDRNDNKTTNVCFCNKPIDMNTYPYVIPTTLNYKCPLITNECPTLYIPASPSCFQRPGWQWSATYEEHVKKNQH